MGLLQWPVGPFQLSSPLAQTSSYAIACKFLNLQAKTVHFKRAHGKPAPSRRGMVHVDPSPKHTAAQDEPISESQQRTLHWHLFFLFSVSFAQAARKALFECYTCDVTEPLPREVYVTAGSTVTNADLTKKQSNLLIDVNDITRLYTVDTGNIESQVHSRLRAYGVEPNLFIIRRFHQK